LLGRGHCGDVTVLKAAEHKQWEVPETPLRFMEVNKPIIGAINGMALGGGLEIALICDIRIAAEHARFGCPEVNLGIMPGWGATQRLTRIIPRAKAAELVFSGKPINAQEAYRIGLVNEVVPKNELAARTQKWAERPLPGKSSGFESRERSDDSRLQYAAG